ncbi:MAG: hypothetical protein A3F31_04875 [Candidatus Levybacteria bacterium RIFCSPHIGHO2_12_FULL_38_12]|nr:MAG: hypothetical protein A2770_04560 [Candidatus Levybacteria bacterium RIFCSPHIGHO2_01_FULL_38_12]OGH21757.1 MAG: hypothetical protein A3D75_01030 [Candidatus Levybacteria bacterium RIFCSPHIGHO2_02_FULL_37_18]OGH22585.1 MAG: hypothetical protein A3F31_04875 [Candidatus Levybacteria bacterium RIFCSPHIGHO2_12_FULL_38_12]OGH33378.1 MAG: hypothetical protein A3A47_03980 [Candidatus Levybacteria bacterium RIFCSPLOWO2_01_FULL_37_20]OGH44123.1 MAG: hypothetical protein A3J14_05245 [Candidatus Lev
MRKKILIATFSIRENNKRTSINGMIEPLLSFFLPQAHIVDLIDGFHPGSSNVISTIEQYTNGKLKRKNTLFVSILLRPFLSLFNQNATQIPFKIRDLLAVIEWGFRSNKTYDLFIGLESIYTLSGIFLKKLGLVKTVVYYVSDYSPNRYPNKIINNIYLSLDRFCVRHADFVWDVSPAIHPARIKAGLHSKKTAPVILVPNALFKEQIAPCSESGIKPHSLVYAGTLTKSNGPDIAVEAMYIILKKIPRATLHIFGSNGADQARIKALIQKYSLEKSVIFHGFITQVADITNATNKYSIGLAPYLDIAFSHRKYGDATKLRLYMGAGIPIITTDVPPLGKELEKFGSALITNDSAEKLAESVIKLFSDKKLWTAMRKKAIEYSKSNTWNNTYRSALAKMRHVTNTIIFV